MFQNDTQELSEALAATLPPPWATGEAAIAGARAEKLRMHHVREAVANDPQHPEANNALARWLAVNGHTADAARHYTAAGPQSDTAGAKLPAVCDQNNAGMSGRGHDLAISTVHCRLQLGIVLRVGLKPSPEYSVDMPFKYSDV